MAGLLSAIKLHEAGFTDITVYEKADRLGGTWRENTYPGIACDVPSHLYTYSFAPDPDWSHVFSPGAEILGYLEAAADRHAVAGLVRYGTEVRRLGIRRAPAGGSSSPPVNAMRPTSSSPRPVCCTIRGIPTSTGSTSSRGRCSTAPGGITTRRCPGRGSV